mmetsp:Transcript_78641/g.225327  ORF Transcript_78641/g.225327 Transcript_78641/m.225327 type:complete len:204 (+) Transcript_78641:309-920(+)
MRRFQDGCWNNAFGGEIANVGFLVHHRHAYLADCVWSCALLVFEKNEAIADCLADADRTTATSSGTSGSSPTTEAQTLHGERNRRDHVHDERRRATTSATDDIMHMTSGGDRLHRQGCHYLKNKAPTTKTFCKTCERDGWLSDDGSMKITGLDSGQTSFPNRHRLRVMRRPYRYWQRRAPYWGVHFVSTHDSGESFVDCCCNG